MEPDELMLEPQEAVVHDHHSTPVDEHDEASVNHVHVPPMDDTMSISSSVSLGRRRGRGVRLAGDKTESAMVLPSFIWDYFVKDASGKYVICTLCPAQTTRFAYSGGTSTMNRHLRKKHQKYAPGKGPADYETPRGAQRRQLELQPLTSPVGNPITPPLPAGLLMSSDPVTNGLGTSSPDRDRQRHQLVELRTARRRVATGGVASKRSKAGTDLTTTTTLATDFDPSGFVTFTSSGTTATSGALQFPVGFELNDAGMDAMAGAALDQRFFDYSTLVGASVIGRSRRPSAAVMGGNHSVTGSNGTSGSAMNGVSQKILTHRLLKYLIAQYEPLDMPHMGPELGMLLFGGSTEWLVPGGAFGYGGAGMGGAVPKLPSEEAMKVALANLYYSQREILKEVMLDVQVLSLSLNNWTSAYGQNVLTVSGHWISHGFRRRDCVLEVYVLPLDERVNTIALLRDVMDKWDIPASKVAALTMRLPKPTTDTTRQDDTDTPPTVAEVQAEATAETSAIHGEYPGLAVVRCFVEELEGAISSGLQKCTDLTRRCRNYVSYFIQNPSEYQIFLALQRSMGEEASAATAASTQAASIAATADGVSVSIAESGNTTMGDESNDVRSHHSDAVRNDAASTTLHTSAIPQTHASSGNVGEVLPVICDFDERWNSTSEMMCRIVQLEPMLLRYKTGLDSDTNPARRPMQLRFMCCALSPEEWAALKQLARLLDRIEGLVHVSPLEYPGLSIMYPLLHSLKKHLVEARTWVTDPLVAVVRYTIISNLNMELCFSGQAPSSPYLSCLLDPRFKTLPFLSTSEKDRLVESLYVLLGVHEKDDVIDNDQLQQNMVVEEDQADEQKNQGRSAKASSGFVSGVASAKKKATALLHEFFPLDEPANEIDKVKAQVQQYLDSPSLPATDNSEHDPLEWWSRYQRLFPSLARLAKKYLCMSAVSTPFKEAFTNYGQLMREKKARLDIEVAAQVLFCRSVSRIPEMERIGV